VTVARFSALCRRTFPGFDDLAANARAALISLVFNRGNSMVGLRRAEMRAIRDLVPKKDYAGIAKQLRARRSAVLSSRRTAMAWGVAERRARRDGLPCFS
jgi:GH24 family phage-related lysozyme (muramidase)